MAEATPQTPLTRAAGIEVPLVCGAMYPCSNPELVAAVSEAGGIGIVQPISLTYVHGHDFREGLRLIRRLTAKPIGMNALIEQSSKAYRERMERWIDVALEEGVRFFVTSLGNPRWVVDRVLPGGRRRLPRRHRAEVGREGRRGRRARPHRRERPGRAGTRGAARPRPCSRSSRPSGCPSSARAGSATSGTSPGRCAWATRARSSGPASSPPPSAAPARPTRGGSSRRGERDIVLTERLTGVPVAVIDTPSVRRLGTKAGPLARFMLRGRRTKHWMRTLYALRSLWALKRGLLRDSPERDFWQAGKSVAGIDADRAGRRDRAALRHEPGGLRRG